MTDDSTARADEAVDDDGTAGPVARTAGHGARTDDADDTVVALRRPPIRQSTVVRSGREHTFDVFVDTIADWWPLQPYSLGGERVRDVAFDRRTGGRVHETWDDGTEVTWGHLLTWDPPERFVMTWEATPAATEVELVFRSLGPRLTKVDVEHRGWERLSPEQFAGATRMLGGYSTGWITILDALAAAAEATTAPSAGSGTTASGTTASTATTDSGRSSP